MYPLGYVSPNSPDIGDTYRRRYTSPHALGFNSSNAARLSAQAPLR